MLNIGYRTACEIGIDILEIFLQILKGLSLRLVIWIFFQITKPHVIILPINIPNGIHNVYSPASRNLQPLTHLHRAIGAKLVKLDDFIHGHRI